jgi:hypothetical protein
VQRDRWLASVRKGLCAGHDERDVIAAVGGRDRPEIAGCGRPSKIGGTGVAARWGPSKSAGRRWLNLF